MHEIDEALLFLLTIDWHAWLKSLLIIICGYFLAKFISTRANRLAQSRLSRSQQVLLSRGLFGSVFFLFLAASFQQLGFHITALLSAAGIITVAVGFAAQTSMSNLISGVFLLGEHSIRIAKKINKC
jgi:small-conductance mechanosensitive channel